MCQSKDTRILQRETKYYINLISSNVKNINDIIISIREFKKLDNEQIKLINELNCEDKMKIIELYNYVLSFIVSNLET